MYQFFTKTKAAANTSRAMECRDHPKNAVSPKNHRSRGNILINTVLFFSIFCLSVTNMFAQDVITLKSGNEIKAIVQDIGTDDVKYKKFDNPSGPNYTLKKTEIIMIVYANGSKDVFAEPALENQSREKEVNTTTSAKWAVGKKNIIKLLNDYNLEFSDMITGFCCTYIGGHPDRDRESTNIIMFGVKNGKLIFFEGNNVLVKHGLNSCPDGGLTSDKVSIDFAAQLRYLFYIPTDGIKDISVGGVGIVTEGFLTTRVTTVDASVKIYWTDGRYTSTTEFHFQGSDANRRANALRNAFYRITR